MSNDVGTPYYDLEDLRIVSSPRELRTMDYALRSTILELLLERAATVSELAAAVGRPRSTVAHHVGVLADARMLKVVRTRRNPRDPRAVLRPDGPHLLCRRGQP